MLISLTYRVIEGGQFCGLPALFLSPGRSELEGEEVENKIIDFGSQYNMHMKILVIDSSEEIFPQEDEYELVKVLQGLHELGWSFMYKVNAVHKPMYLFIPGHVVIVIRDGEEPTFNVNEVHWMPESDWEEPALLKREKALRFLVPGKKGLRGAYEFLAVCQKAWAIVLPSKQVAYTLIK